VDRRFRELFNKAFTPALYERVRRDLPTRLGAEFEFRLAETPVFLPRDLGDRLTTAANEIVDQLSLPDRLSAMKRAIPPKWDTPGMDSLPSFTQVDFAVVRDSDGTLVPKLIELQGFPSLSALQVIQRDSWNDILQSIDGLDLDWSCWYSGLDRTGFLTLAREVIVGSHDPAEVILMDIDPPHQKTYPDFVATKMLFDVDAVCPTTLIKKGKTLWRRDARGREIQVKRIYNRVVFDELILKGIDLPFDFREELDVEWAPHPNWYWTWSKYSLPFLDHPAVPRATLVSNLDRVPDDLSAFVLKPLFSFAGAGVNVDPMTRDLAAIPDEQKSSWCIQEKIEYEPALLAADGGGVKVEIRMMFFRPDNVARPILAQNLCRLSRGKMLGVDFNKNFTWVGSSLALQPSSS